MTKMFCDRCGKEIKEEYGWITNRMLYASIRFLPGKKHTEWSDRGDLYICPKCEDSYISWLMTSEAENRR